MLGSSPNYAILGVKHKEKESGQVMGISKLYTQSTSPVLVEQVQYKPASPNSPHECWTLSTRFLTIAKTSHNEAQYEYELLLDEENTGQENFEQLVTRFNKRLGVPQGNFEIDLDKMEIDAKEQKARDRQSTNETYGRTV